MQDFWKLNQNSYIDKYSMKEIAKCIGNISVKLKHFLNLGPIFRILENEPQWRFARFDGLHHSGQRIIPLNYFTYGTTHLPHKLSKFDGRHSQRYQKCPHLHWWPTGTHRQSWKATACTRSGFSPTAPKSSKNQLGQMSIWKQRSIILGLHTNTRRHQTREERPSRMWNHPQISIHSDHSSQFAISPWHT